MICNEVNENMKCPQCQSEVKDGAKFCTNCGARMESGGNFAQAQQTAKLATNTGILLGKKAREARLQEAVDPNAILSARVYNAVIVGVLLWGLLINWLLCSSAGVRSFVLGLNPWVLIIGYLVLAISGTVISAKSHNPLISFLGYNMVVIPLGLVLSYVVTFYIEQDPAIVTNAFLYTMLISLGIMALVMIMPQFFAKIGGFVAGALLGVILCEIVLLIFHVHQEVTNWLIAGLFSLYLGYDIYRSQQYPKTLDNAIDSALDIYLDIANLFIRLLEIMGKKDSN